MQPSTAKGVAATAPPLWSGYSFFISQIGSGALVVDLTTLTTYEVIRLALSQSYAVFEDIKRVKSPINRMGGKFFLRHWLAGKIPSHRVYVEPFCGAGHLLFSKLPSAAEVINDIDNQLIGFFRIIQTHETRQSLIDRLEYMPYSRRLWQEIRERWKQGNIPDDPIEASAMWFYLNRATFSGDQENGGFAVPSVTGRNPSMSFANTIESLSHVARRLKGVTIENLNYADCIQRYDSLNTLFYVDAPYCGAEHYYGRGIFAYDDHQALARLLYEVKGKVMITHYQESLYDDLYRDWYRFTYDGFKGSCKTKINAEKPKTIEVLYCNFEPTQGQNELFRNG